MNLLKKESLKNGYYYSGFVLKNYDAINLDQPRLTCMWDVKENCFWSWDDEGNIKSKRKFCYLPDITDEINAGFVPMKEVIPRESDVI